MIGFGSKVTGFRFINYFVRNADNALLGYVWGAGPLGLYARAYSLVMLPAGKLNGPITNVVVPVLSRVRDDAAKYARVYLACLTPLAYFQTLLIGCVVLNVENLVALVLGEQWIELVPIFYALTLACVTTGTNVVSGWLYLSFGHVDAQVKHSLVQSIVTLLALIVAVQFGVIATAWTISIVYTISKPLVILYASHPTPVRATDILMCIYKPIVLTLIALAMTMAMVIFVFDPVNPWLQIASRSALYSGFTLVCLTTPWFKNDVIGVFKNARAIRLGKQS